MATNHVERPRKNEDQNRLIKRFVRKCKKLGIINEVRDKKHFVSKSVKRRLAKKKAIARNKKKK